MNRPPALVLTAGLGTRLRPLTYLRAKGAMPVNGEALAARVARWLAGHGIVQQVFNLHHHPATIAAALGAGDALGIDIRYSWEDPVLGSAGGPRHALPLLRDTDSPDHLVVNGDTLTDVDLDALLHAHRTTGARVTMALIPNPAPDKYGGVLVDANGVVTGFSRRGVARESCHFIGVQVVRDDVFADLPDGVPDESVGRLYPALMQAEYGAVRGFVSRASFRDIGTPADYLQTSVEIAADEGERLVSPRADVHASATCERTIVWDDVTVGANARLVNCIVGDGAHIPAGATYSDCAIIGAGGFSPGDGERIAGGLLLRPLPREQTTGNA
jgi:NDP-sugar pyrophosphorylase family protein